METPTYASMRDRVTADGEHWLNQRMRDFISGKLVDNNTEYTDKEKKRINRKMRIKVGVNIKAHNLLRKIYYSMSDDMKLKLLRTLKRSK